MATDTWAEALRDPHVPIHWLMEISGLGAPLRFADTDLSIGGDLWTGALSMRTNPGVYVDPYTSAPSSPNCVVMLRPFYISDPGAASPLRVYDLEATWRTNFATLFARVYRWAEGTPITERQTMVNGYIHELKLDASGNWSLTIVDKILKYNRRLPRYYVNERTWADSHADDQGAGYPILYGSFSKIQAPMVDDTDATYDYALVADGTIATVTQAYLDDVVAATEALAAGTDALGRTVSLVSFEDASEAIGDKQVTVSGTGYADNTSGEFTGTPSQLIQHPADQLRHMARTFAGMPESEIDTASFIAMREELPGWTMQPQVLSGDDTSFFAIREEMGTLCRSAIYPEKGKLTARHLRFTRPPALNVVEGENLVEMMDIDWGEKSNLITSLLIKYSWGWQAKGQTNTWRKSLLIDADDDPVLAANKQLLRGLGTADIDRRRVITARMIQAQVVAERVADKLIELHSIRKTAKIRVGRDAHNLAIYDVVRLTANTYPSSDGAGMVGKRWVVTGITYGLDTDDLQLLEA